MVSFNQKNNIFIPTQGEGLWSEIEQSNVFYKEWLPCKELQPYVACYWIFKVKAIPKENVISRVIPDGCMDIIFNIANLAKGKGGSVVGTMLSPETNAINELRELVGVRFWPGGIVPFIKNSAKDFTESSISLEYIWGKEDSMLCQTIFSASRNEDRIRTLEETLKGKLKEISFTDTDIQKMIYNVYKNKGNLSIKDLTTELNISQRHLSRKVNLWLGISPKTFSNIVRFQNIVNELNTKPNSNLIKVALNNGYYDQAHFTKEFKGFYGKTPGQLKL